MKLRSFIFGALSGYTLAYIRKHKKLSRPSTDYIVWKGEVKPQNLEVSDVWIPKCTKPTIGLPPHCGDPTCFKKHTETLTK